MPLPKKPKKLADHTGNIETTQVENIESVQAIETDAKTTKSRKTTTKKKTPVISAKVELAMGAFDLKQDAQLQAVANYIDPSEPKLNNRTQNLEASPIITIEPSQTKPATQNENTVNHHKKNKNHKDFKNDKKQDIDKIQKTPVVNAMHIQKILESMPVKTALELTNTEYTQTQTKVNQLTKETQEVKTSAPEVAQSKFENKFDKPRHERNDRHPRKNDTYPKHNQGTQVHTNQSNPTNLNNPAGHAQQVAKQGKKLFVLDTNVLLHDPTSLFRFEEHDIYLSMIVLEELDNHKKGLSEVSRNARSISRTLDQLLNQKTKDLDNGVNLSLLGNIEAKGTLFFETKQLNVQEIPGFTNSKADNHILSIVIALQKMYPERLVCLVSKDINMRIKANALSILAQDYYNDHVIDDMDLLYTGSLELPSTFWHSHAGQLESWQNSRTGDTFYRIQGPMIAQFHLNQFVYLDLKDGSIPFYAQVMELNTRQAVLKTLVDYSHPKHKIWGINARNKEQNFAMNLLMNPEVDFVSLLGQAGTGKTLLTLAAAIKQVIDEKQYNEIIMTRATVPLGEDIGFLPGSEEEKMQPWMGALDDNLEVLQGESGDWNRSNSLDYIRSKIKVKSMSFMRGRTFVNKFLIIDEAQNLTPKQMKALITRAGPNTKIVCMGNIAQIDTPYLTEGSSGLTYVVDRFKGWAHGGHITLARGERSRLADFASDVL